MLSFRLYSLVSRLSFRKFNKFVMQLQHLRYYWFFCIINDHKIAQAHFNSFVDLAIHSVEHLLSCEFITMHGAFYQQFQENMQKGEKIVTIAGIHGTVNKINEDGTIMLETSPGSYLKIEKSAISMEWTNQANKAVTATTK